MRESLAWIITCQAWMPFPLSWVIMLTSIWFWLAWLGFNVIFVAIVVRHANKKK